MSGDGNLHDIIAAFFDELVAAGVNRLVASPGSRSTPLTVVAHRTAGLDVSLHLDERSAGFWALGAARASGRPVALVCTSGTAAANYLPAIVEAHYSEVPLVVLTADRPPELRDRGAGQTIDQLGIYGSHVRWWADLPVPGDVGGEWFRSTAARAVRAATGPRPGPVHLNWPLREPLEPPVGWQPPVRSTESISRVAPRQPVDTAPVRAPVHPSMAEHLEAAAASPRGLVLAGPMDRDHGDVVADFCRRTGWPLLAEPLSQLRRRREGVTVLGHHDHLLRTAWADRHVPDVVIRIGQPMTCKPLRLWLERHRPNHVLLDPAGTWTDASTTVTSVIDAGPDALAGVTVERGETSWTRDWAIADDIATGVADEILDGEPLLEAAIARQLGRSLPSGANLYVSNSMPVRDVDSFLRPRIEPLRYFGNRGASGIDGVTSSAAGVAAADGSATLYIGDLAFLHDLSGLLAAARHDVDLTIVVADNKGGGIFSFLPIADHDDELDFEALFRTPQGHDLAALARAAGAHHQMISDADDLGAALSRAGDGLRVLQVPVERDANVEQHRRVAAAIASALPS